MAGPIAEETAAIAATTNYLAGGGPRRPKIKPKVFIILVDAKTCLPTMGYTILSVLNIGYNHVMI